MAMVVELCRIMANGPITTYGGTVSGDLQGVLSGYLVAVRGAACVIDGLAQGSLCMKCLNLKGISGRLLMPTVG